MIFWHGASVMTEGAKHGLELRNISKTYGNVVAVDGVSLSVKPGHFLTLLGPSGSGKTTILMAIAGFVQPSAGQILLDGTVINDLPAEKRNFGMVFQGYALFPHLTVAQNIGFPLKIRGRPKDEINDRVASALDLVQLGHLTERMPKELSGGQQQRVALARALVFEPALLLLDEPLSALDRKLRAELQWELKSLHQQVGMTFIYVTHDQDEALSMSDEIIILNHGKIVQMGSPRELYDRPTSRFVANFMGGSNFLKGRVVAAQKGSFTYSVGPYEFCQATMTAEHREGTDILIALSPDKVSISSDRPQSGQNAIEGQIRSFNYYGNSFHFLVENQAIGAIEVKTPAWQCSVEPSVGEGQVWLSWPPEASIPVIDD